MSQKLAPEISAINLKPHSGTSFFNRLHYGMQNWCQCGAGFWLKCHELYDRNRQTIISCMWHMTTIFYILSPSLL